MACRTGAGVRNMAAAAAVYSEDRWDSQLGTFSTAYPPMYLLGRDMHV